jgi:hypothetical protein
MVRLGSKNCQTFVLRGVFVQVHQMIIALLQVAGDEQYVPSLSSARSAKDLYVRILEVKLSSIFLFLTMAPHSVLPRRL